MIYVRDEECDLTLELSHVRSTSISLSLPHSFLKRTFESFFYSISVHEVILNKLTGIIWAGLTHSQTKL